MKTYNMAHLLVTRYSIKEDFGVSKGLEKLDALESQIKEKKSELAKLQNEKKEENNAKIEALQKTIGEEKDKYREAVREVKAQLVLKCTTDLCKALLEQITLKKMKDKNIVNSCSKN